MISLVVISTGNPVALSRLLQSLRDQRRSSDLCELVLIFTGPKREGAPLHFITPFSCRTYEKPHSTTEEALCFGASVGTSPWVIYLSDEISLPHRDWLIEVWQLLRHSTVFEAYTGYYLTASGIRSLNELRNECANAMVGKKKGDQHEIEALLKDLMALPKIHLAFICKDGLRASTLSRELSARGVSLKQNPVLSVYRQTDLTTRDFLRQARLSGAQSAEWRMPWSRPYLLMNPLSWAFAFYFLLGKCFRSRRGPENVKQSEDENGD